MIQSPLSTCGSLPSAHMPQIHWPNFGSASQSANIFSTTGPLHMLFLLNTFPFSLFFTTLLPLIVLLDYICLAPPFSCCKAFLIPFFVSCTTHHSLQFNFSVYTFFFLAFVSEQKEDCRKTELKLLLFTILSPLPSIVPFTY